MSQTVPHKIVFKSANLVSLSIAVAAGLLVWLIPPPVGVSQNAWQLLSIFVGLIVGLIGKALPMGGMSFLALTLLIVTHTLTTKEALSGFCNPIIWLVVAAFLLSRSFIKTQLGMRIAYQFISLLGQKTLGLGYGVAATEVLLAPAIPSNTARSGGVVFPIVRALAVSFGSTPERHSQRLMGSYLVLVAYYSNLISSAMFVTAMAANPLIIGIMNQNGLSITWGQWALMAAVPGLISLVLVPYLVYKVYPPEIKNTPESKALAQQHLDTLGPMSKYEAITLGVFVLLVALWIFGEQYFGFDSTVVALIGITILLLTGVLTWDDIKREHEAWDTLIWFSTLVMMSSFLNQLGLIDALSNFIRSYTAGIEWHVAWPMLTLLYFYAHYFFASNTAHVTSLYAAFFTIGLGLGVPPYLMALSLAVSSSLFACLTHYGTGCAPILFGSEYVNLKTWWRMGLLMSVVFLVIWVGVGALWWKVLGYW